MKIGERVFLATTGSGLARATRDADGAWSVASSLQDHDVRSLAADPLNANVVYAGTQGDGVLRSDDRGQTWVSVGMEVEILEHI